MTVKKRHSIFSVGILLTLFFVFGSCQNRNQVTHNKRKYRKGYYKPNRAKVKHKKTNKEEEYAYGQDVSKKENTSKKISAQKHREKRVDEELQTNEENTRKFNVSDPNVPQSTQDQPEQINNEQTNQQAYPSKDSEIETEEEPKEKTSKKTNWIYWVSLVLLILTLAAAALIILNIFVFALIAVGLSAVGFTLSVINYKKYKKEPDTNFTKASSALMFAFFLVILLGGILFIVISQTSF